MKTTELCPICGQESEMPEKLGVYKCQNCGAEIINCSMCTEMDCKNCTLTGITFQK